MRPAHPLKSDPEERLASSVEPSFDPSMYQPPARPLPVGAKARRLQRRILLRDRSPAGLYWLFDQFLGRPLVNLCRIVPMIRLVGAQARRECGVSIRRQVWDQVRLILFHGAKPWIYYVLELYRDGAMAEAGAYVMRNEVKHGLFKALNRIDPEARDRARKLGDKLEVSRWCVENQIAHPRPIMLVENGEISWPGGSRADLDRDLFVKLRRGRGAHSSASYWRTAPFEYRDDENRPVDPGADHGGASAPLGGPEAGTADGDAAAAQPSGDRRPGGRVADHVPPDHLPRRGAAPCPDQRLSALDDQARAELGRRLARGIRRADRSPDRRARTDHGRQATVPVGVVRSPSGHRRSGDGPHRALLARARRARGQGASHRAGAGDDRLGFRDHAGRTGTVGRQQLSRPDLS